MKMENLDSQVCFFNQVFSTCKRRDNVFFSMRLTEIVTKEGQRIQQATQGRTRINYFNTKIATLTIPHQKKMLDILGKGKRRNYEGNKLNTVIRIRFS